MRPVHILSHHRPQNPWDFSPCSHWRQSRTPGFLTLVHGQGGKTESGDFFHLRQGLLLGHSGMEEVSSRIILKPSGSKKEEQRPFTFFWCLYCGNYLSINGTPALRSFIYVDVGEPTPHPCSMTGMMKDHHLL